MRVQWIIFLAGIMLALAAAPAFAHHSFVAEYDSNKPATLKGAATKIDMKDETSKVTNRELELGNPNGLMRRGWTRNSLTPGDNVIVEGYLAKDGGKLANASNVTLAAGRKIFAGSSDDGGPSK
jgi:Family of unknown function (DUF6152)